jgi:hypothetical protein
VPDREAAARLATLRRAGVDLERRLRADDGSAPDSEAYWRTQLDAWRADIDEALARFLFHQRAVQQVPRGRSADDGSIAWADALLAELHDIRSRLDLTISRLI